MNFAIFVALGTMGMVFFHLPSRIADGEIYRVYFSYRLLIWERKSRFARVLLFVIGGIAVIQRYGLASLEFIGFVIGGVLVASALVTLLISKRSDEASGGSIDEIV